jgi:hypothetical protein
LRQFFTQITPAFNTYFNKKHEIITPPRRAALNFQIRKRGIIGMGSLPHLF